LIWAGAAFQGKEVYYAAQFCYIHPVHNTDNNPDRWPRRFEACIRLWLIAVFWFWFLVIGVVLFLIA